MKSKGPKFNAMSAAMGGMGRKTGMSALTAGPLDQIKNIFGQPKQPAAGAMDAMDQASNQSMMGQDKIGCSDGMMSKSPLKAGAYEDPTTAMQSFDNNIATTINETVVDAVDSSIPTSDGNTNADVKVNSLSKQARIDGRKERSDIRQKHRSTRIKERNVNRARRTQNYQNFRDGL